MATEDTDRRTIARLADELLPTLIERLARSELGELEVREQGWRIRLRRPTAPATADVAGMPAAAGMLAAAAGAIKARRADTSHSAPMPMSSPPAADAGRADPLRGVVTSPAVGYFAPRDGVAVGGRLRSGDTIGHVDMLGVRHEVVSRVDGTLKAIEVEVGQAVEYGQPIARMVADV